MLSSRKKQLTWKDVEVGLFIVIGLAIIIAALLYFQPGQHFGSTVQVRTLFSSVQGLTVGEPVVMSGVQIGTVTSISFLTPDEIKSFLVNKAPLAELANIQQKMINLNVKNPIQKEEYEKLQQEYRQIQRTLKHVRVVMSIQASYVPFLRKDSVATLKSEGIMGQREVDISMGTPGAAPETPILEANNERAYEIPSQEGTDFNQVLANASKATDALNDIMEQIDVSIKSGNGTLGQLIKNKSLYKNLQSFLSSSATATRYTGELLNSVRQGRGTVGKFFTDPSVFNSAKELLGDVQNGKGTFGQLVTNPALYNNSNQLMDHMNHIMGEVEHGHGTLHKLIENPSLYNQTNRVMANLAKLTQGMNEGKGSLGKLAKDETFYKNANQAMANLALVSEEIKEGQGSLGLLIKDKSLYENLTQLSAELVKFMRDFQKNPRKYLTVQFSVVKIF
jgi:phospholipid/cholesterol/gamma-HCH transport system substrate-binding protein